MPISVPITTDVKVIYQESYLRCWSKLFSMEIKNFDKTRGKFLLEIKREIFPFKMKWIPWAAVQNINKVLKVSRLLATSLEILAPNTQFSVTLATSWSQFRTMLYRFVFWLMWLIGYLLRHLPDGLHTGLCPSTSLISWHYGFLTGRSQQFLNWSLHPPFIGYWLL